MGYLQSCHPLQCGYLTAVIFLSLKYCSVIVVDFCFPPSWVWIEFLHDFLQVSFFFIPCMFINSSAFSFTESRLEGWLSIPNRTNIKRYGWKKQVRCTFSLLLWSHQRQNWSPFLSFIVFSMWWWAAGRFCSTTMSRIKSSQTPRWYSILSKCLLPTLFQLAGTKRQNRHFRSLRLVKLRY